MITIPLYSLLFLYLIFIAIFAAFVFINVYHLSIGASLTVASFTITLVVFFIGSLILFETHNLLQSTDWQKPLATFQFGISEIGDL